HLTEVNDTGSQGENSRLPAMTATLSLGLYGRAIVPMPKKARRRPVYGTATPLRCLMDMAHSFFRVQNIAHARLCQSLKEFHRNSALPPSPQACNDAHARMPDVYR